MKLSRAVLLTALVVACLPAISRAAPFYTPPCINERDSTDDALSTLQRCLLKQSHPPFKTDKEAESPPICSREMSAFLDLRDAYRKCLKPFAQSDSQTHSKVEASPLAPRS